MRKASVAHLTSVHGRYDTRIFLKECRSLAKAGYDVHLIVADNKGHEIKDLVSISDVGAPLGRMNRMVSTTRKVYEKSVSLNADIYHLHDPELLPIGFKLKRQGKVVMFDAHEDMPKQLLSKPYLSKSARVLLSTVLGSYEKWVCRRLDAVITATPFINEKFKKINPTSVNINNFPMIGELGDERFEQWQGKSEICYVGGIANIRGIKEVVTAMGLLKASGRLQLVGRFSERSTESEVKAYPGWSRVDELGFLDRRAVRDVLSRVVAGLVTFHPLPNHVDAQPNKMFEYMSAGVPVIASNFPLWREIIEGNDCGLCVDPMNPHEIAEAMDFLITHQERAKEMGENGQRAVKKYYNWDVEERKLLDLYSKLIK